MVGFKILSLLALASCICGAPQFVQVNSPFGFRAVPIANIHGLQSPLRTVSHLNHATPVVQAVRTTHVNHASPVVQAVRTINTPAFTHVNHASPFFQDVRATHLNHGSPVVQAVRTINTPFFTHVNHATPVVQAVRTTHLNHGTPVVQAVRTINTPAFTQVNHASPVIQAGRTPVVSHVASPAIATAAVVRAEDQEGFDPNPQYSFGYSVADTITGDSKTREESRDGNVVTGSYTVADPDGRLRRVTYTADALHGFQAQVTYDGEAGPPAIPIAAKSQPVFGTAAVAPAATAVSDDEVVVTEVRNNNDNVNALPTVIRTAVPNFSNGATRLIRLNAAPALHATPFGLRTIPAGLGFIPGARFIHQ